jgi:hypothetical protein
MVGCNAFCKVAVGFLQGRVFHDQLDDCDI